MYYSKLPARIGINFDDITYAWPNAKMTGQLSGFGSHPRCLYKKVIYKCIFMFQGAALNARLLKINEYVASTLAAIMCLHAICCHIHEFCCNGLQGVTWRYIFF
jgi:hypothetical protein